jgi:hypothetical protein
MVLILDFKLRVGFRVFVLRFGVKILIKVLVLELDLGVGFRLFTLRFGFMFQFYILD